MARTLFLPVIFLLVTLLLLDRMPAFAAAQATVITDCTAAGVTAAVAQGGRITFNCGATPVTITIGEITLAAGQNVTLDGANLITLSGGGVNRLFHVTAGASLTLQKLILTDGFSAAAGGALFNEGALTLEQTTVRNSKATSGAGIDNLTGTLIVSASQIVNNQATGSGGGLSSQAGTVTLDNTLVENNQAVSSAGIDSVGQLFMRNSTVRGNLATSGYGGGIGIAAGNATIETSLIAANQAGSGGGGLYISANAEAQVTIRESRILNNQAAPSVAGTQGGGINSGNALALERVTVDGNAAAVAGGLYQYGSAGQLTVRDTTFSHNSATQVAGGLALLGALGHTLTNVTVSDNSAGDRAGGIYAVDYPVALRFVTLADNSAPLGANLYNVRTTFTLGGVIFATPLGGGTNCDVEATGQPVNSEGYNLASDASCSLNGGGDQANLDPKLGALTDNGGPTLTHLPQAGSPALDTIPPAACVASDQRRFPRPFGPACDSGAVETGATAPTPVPPPPDPPTAQPTTPPTAEPTATDLPTAAPTSVLQPALLPNAVQAALTVAPAHAYAGQQVTLAGDGVTGATQVQLTTVQNGQTVSIATVPVTAQGGYSLALAVPAAQRVGPLQFCALPVGVPNAALTCAAFVVDPMPTGALQGQIQSQPNALFAANVNLIDGNGRLKYVVPVDGQGRFQINEIVPGRYQAVVTGQTSMPVEPAAVTVLPGTTAHPQLPSGTTICVPGVSHSSVLLRLTSDIPAAAPSGQLYNQIGPVRWSPLKPDPLTDLAVDLAKFQRDYFGVYVSGVTRQIDFTAFPQTSALVQKVIFRLVAQDGHIVKQAEDSNAPFTMNFDISSLPPSEGDRHPQIWAIPVVNGQELCPSAFPVHMLKDPLQNANFKPLNGGTLWNEGHGRYEFSGIIPQVNDVGFRLPPAPIDIPYFGGFDNRFHAGVVVRGIIEESGHVELTAIRAEALVRILNVDLFNSQKQLDVGQLTNVWNTLDNWEIPLPAFDLVPQQYVGMPFIVTPVFDFFGLIQVQVASSGGINYGVKFSGWVKPFTPAVSLKVTGAGEATGELGFGLGTGGGVASAGAAVGFGAGVKVPVTVRLAERPTVDLEACLTLRVFIHAWAEVLWGLIPGTRYDQVHDVARYPAADQDESAGCIKPLQAAQVQTDPVSAPQLFAAPSVAVSADGQVLSAYVENTAVTGGAPQVQILARFQDPATGQWQAPLPLSDPTHSATNPVAFFAGPTNLPLVTWVEKPYTAATAQALGDDFNTHLRRQEIFYALFKAGAWSTPVRLTNDLLADGLPTAAGSSAGALLAWTRDLDGNASTLADQRVAVTLFDPHTEQFGPLTLLGAPTGGMNADVRSAYDPTTNPPTPNLVWINDRDANIATPDDRRIAWARWTPDGWATLDPQPLPPRVDSPALSAGADGLHLAFLRRTANADGAVSVLGANGVVWTADLVNGQWRAAPLRDEQGNFIYGEQPRLATAQNETLLAFRRFSHATTNAALGQISLSRTVAGNAFSAPLYATDEPSQNWQPALAVNPLNRQAIILKVARPVSPLRAAQYRTIATTQATLARQQMTLNTAEDPVGAIFASATADPALDPLQVSTSVPAAGQPVAVVATVRNVGRDLATGLTVTLYQGQPGSGVLLQTRTTTVSLTMNATAAFTFTLTAGQGEQPLYAELTTTGPNATAVNDHATFVLGRPSQPTLDSVQASVLVDAALDLQWHGGADEQPTGYRVLRSASVDGPFTLVGETAIPHFTDTLLERGQSYCYQVQAYNGSAVSAASTPQCGAVASLAVYLPLVVR